MRRLLSSLMDWRGNERSSDTKVVSTLKGIKLPPLFGKIRVNFDDLHAKLLRWVRAILQSVDF